MRTISIVFVVLATSSAWAFEPCATRITNAASMALAEKMDKNVQDIRIVRTDMGVWTEMPANNVGSAEVAVRSKHSDKISHFAVTAKQVGSSSDCKVTQVQLLDSESIDPVVRKAEKYKAAIGDATYMSEADYPWEVVVSRSVASENPLPAEIATALNLDPNQTEVFSHEDAVNLLKQYSEDTELDYMDRIQYKRLLEAFLNDHRQIMMVRSGEVEVKVYILGRDSSGHLIGVKTISVET